MFFPSQAEGEQTPLDAFQLPASVAREDASSPEPEPTGEPHLPAQPLGGPEQPLGPVLSSVEAIYSKSTVQTQEFPGDLGVRTLGSHCHEPGFNTRLVNPTGRTVWHRIIISSFSSISLVVLPTFEELSSHRWPVQIWNTFILTGSPVGWPGSRPEPLTSGAWSHFVVGASLPHCMVFSCIPDIHPLGSRRILLPSCDDQKCLQTWPTVPEGTKPPQRRTMERGPILPMGRLRAGDE